MIKLSAHELSYIAISLFGAYQKQAEFAALVERVEKLQPQSILEIGSGKGGSSWAWSKLAERTISIDLPNGPWGGENGKMQEMVRYIKANTDNFYSYIPGDSKSDEVMGKFVNSFSHEAYFNIEKGTGYARMGVLDFLFIDGDHSYKGVKADYENYSPFVRPGGLIAFHDILEHPKESGCEVKKFWDEVKVGRTSTEYISEPKTWGGLGVLEV